MAIGRISAERTGRLASWLVCAGGLVLSASCGQQESDLDVQTVKLDRVRPSDVEAALARLPGVEVVAEDRQSPYFLRGDLGHVSFRPGAGDEEVARAAEPVLTLIAPVFQLRPDMLVFQRSTDDDRGNRYLRFGQRLNGLKVVGAELILHSDAAGKIHAVHGNARGATPDAMVPRLSARTAVEVALDEARTIEARLEGEPRLVFLRIEADGALRLAWEVHVVGEGAPLPVNNLVYVSAVRGSVLAVHPRVHSALNRNVFSANNATSLPGTLRRSEGGAASGDSQVDHNYDRLSTAYDCFKTVFNRDSFNNAGATLNSSVHYSTSYVNAFWNGAQMAFGDGDGVNSGPLGGDLDVTVHELTHAVTDWESNLVYANEPGALNEGMSDILAAFCSSWTRGWAMDADVWMIAEDSWTPAITGDAARYMGNPTQDGASRDYYPERYLGDSDDGGVHWNSGIANLAFKLLATGGTHPRGKTSVAVPGVGVEVAGRIFYYANTQLFTSSTTFEQAKTYTVQAAAALGYSAAIQDAVAKAWAAVGVPAPPPPPPTITTLWPTVPVMNLSGATGSDQYFSLQVPTRAVSLKFVISGGSGDADLYVKSGSLPSSASFDCRPFLNGNSETCTFNSPQAGTWYVTLHGHASYSGVILVGQYQVLK